MGKTGKHGHEWPPADGMIRKNNEKLKRNINSKN